MTTLPPGRPVEPDGNCDLCGLALRFGTLHHDIGGATYRFCCMGCRQVFLMLIEAAGAPDPSRFKETELFKQCRELGIIPASIDDLVPPSAEITATPPSTEPGFANRGDKAGNRLIDLNLTVGNMWCPACAWVIEQALGKHPGVASTSCSFSTDRVRCSYNPLHTSPDRVITALRRLGYRAALPGPNAAADKKRELIRFCISALLTANVMMLSLALYSGFFSRLDPDTVGQISWPIFLMASGVFFYGGGGIHQRAWAGLISTAPGMETLISIAAVSAYAYSTFNLFAGSIHLYFDTVCMLITLVLLGKMLERRAKDRVQENLDSFFSLQPTKARICTPAAPQGRYVSAGQLAPGDVFKIREGEIVPADGVVLSGQGRMDESCLTGEALPVGVKPGERIRSGSRMVSGNLEARAEAVGEASLLGQMIAIMERAIGKKTLLEGKTDRLLKGFVPVILLLAAANGAFNLLNGLPLETALIRSVTVLVIACPCALGIAIPMARVAGIAAAGKMGLVVRDFSAFEQAQQLNAFVFDKTGTVTEGNWALIRSHSVGSLEQDRIFALASGLEQESDHTVGVLICNEARQRRIQPEQVSQRTVYDNGVSAQLGEQALKIGSETFLAGEIRAAGGPPETYLPTAGTPDVSRVFMSYGGLICAVFEFGDTLRPGVAATIEWLRGRGHRIALVSGDGDATTRAVGTRIGIPDAAGAMLPGAKAAFVADLQARGFRTAMVGDGVNDAPALVQSDLGIAVHSGSHLGKEAADITLMRAEPGQISEFIDLAHAVNRKIHQNLWCAFIYNIVSIPIAMSGLLTPLVAVCAMLLSSLTVIGNTLRLSRHAEAPLPRQKHVA